MKRVLAPCLAAVAVAGTVGFAFQNVAGATNCYGLDVLKICYTPNPGWKPTVDPTGNSIDECVHTGRTCEPVSVPYPAVTPGSGLPAQNIRCYNHGNDCLSPYE